MDKYYTPEIEEFHVGFEYYHATFKDQELSPYIVSIDCNIADIQIELETDIVRVKYLDREDIESIGKTHYPELKWVYDNNSEPIPGRAPYECPTAYHLDAQLHTGQLWLLYHFKSDGMVWIEYIKDCAGQGYIFKGIIRNKSEFKKILERLGL